MAVTNPELAATSRDLYQFSKAIANFERWSGWNTVCVPELQVQPELREGRIVGLYQGPLQPILLASGSGHNTAIHEMCHAADQQLGWVSQGNPELYPVTHIDPVTYSTRDAQVRESFARTCEAGPDGLALVRAIEATCGVPLEHPGYALVLDEVFEDVSPVRAPATLRTLVQEDVGVDAIVGDGTLVDVASGAQLIWFVIRDRDPLLEAGNPTDYLSRTLWRVVGWSPSTRQVVSSQTLLRRPPGVLEANRSLSLLDSIEDPVLVEGTAVSPMHLWRIDEQTSGLVRLDDQPFSTAASPFALSLGGVVQDGVALVRVDDPPEEQIPGAAQPDLLSTGTATSMAGSGWVAIELATGALMDDHHVYKGVLGPNIQGSGTTLTATADGTVAIGLEPTVAPYWPFQAQVVAHDGTRTRLETASAGLSDPIGVDPGQRRLAIWSNNVVWHTIDTRRFFVLQDPSSGDFWVPEDTCQPRSEGMAVDRVMHVNGELWVFGQEVGSSRQILRRLEASDALLGAP